MNWTHPYAELIMPEGHDGTPLAAVPPAPREPETLRRIFSQFPTGIAAICAAPDGTALGMVATSFTVGAAFDPPLVLFAAQRSSRTWPVLRRATRIGVSVLSERNRAAVMQLASRQGDKFSGVPLVRTTQGAVLLRGARLWLDCEHVGEHDLGDHELVVLRVHGASSLPDVEPLIYHDGRVV